MLVNKCIMTGGDKLTIQGIGSFQQCAPFDMGITHHAGIGCAAGQVFFNKIVNNSRAKFIPDIQHKMRKSMLDGCQYAHH